MSTTDCLIYKGDRSYLLKREISMAIFAKDYYNLRDRLSKYFCSDCIEKHSLCYRFRKIIQDEAQNRWVLYRFSSSPIYDFDFYLQYNCKSPVRKEVMNVIKDIRENNQFIKSVNLHKFSKDSDITSVVDKENYRRTIQVPPSTDFKDLEKRTKEDILNTITEESLPELLNQPTKNVVMQCSSMFENLGEFGIVNRDVENLSASEIQLLKTGLGRKFKVNPEAIIITSIKSGSVGINYSIKGQTDPTQVKNGLRNSSNFMHAELHEILTCDAFGLQDFDARGDKKFTSASSFEIGPKGKKRTYTQPLGYNRYGLKVLGTYPNDRWLDPFGDDGNWYRAFHGTRNAFKYMNRDGRTNEEMNRDAMANINKDGFQMARIARFGAGVYCSPSINFLETGRYTGEFGKFKFALQVCVDPDNCDIATDEIYVAKMPQAIRPYGIIIK